ncbi:MAG: methylenetetrahydrofolate reductase C-terminal domain-containing protein [Anaerolineae bacterium]|jgi:ferredoxin
MIVAEQKPLDELKQLVSGYDKVLVLGCGTCVTVCFAGGEKEVGILASSLRMATRLDGIQTEFLEATVQRQCEYEYNEAIAELLPQVDAVLSLACGIGVQTINEQFPEVQTLPGLNTTFLGQPTEQGVWEERCQACGDCVLGTTGGICPISRCAKSLLNGPCGGSQNGVCEVDRETPCAWQLIYDRMSALGKLDLLLELNTMKNWRPSRDGGQRKIVREDLRL